MVVGNIPESTEVAIIGAGPGGYVAAIRLAQLGKEVTLIDPEVHAGGVCLLRGCIPSKALIECSRFFQKAKQMSSIGVHFDNPRVEWAEVQAWKNNIVAKLGKGLSQLFKQQKIKYIQGNATFLNNQELKISQDQGTQTLGFEQAIIATGSRPRPLSSFEFDQKHILSSKEALNLTKIPQSMLIIGGGYIGLELGMVYSRLGSQITIVEATEDILPGIETDLLRPLKKNLKKLGVNLCLNSLCQTWSQNGDSLNVKVQSKEEKNIEFSAEKILVAIGRVPNSEKLGLENTSVTKDEKGFIQVDQQLKTSSESIYAIGDVCGGAMLAHKASTEAKIAAANICGQKDRFDQQVPAVIFTDPELAYVGFQEKEAEKNGIEVKTGMFGFGALGRAQILDETDGFVKVVAEKNTDRVIGVQVVGPHASDLISEATLGIEMGAFIEDFTYTIHPHPTLPEAIEEAMESALGLSIHRYQRKK